MFNELVFTQYENIVFHVPYPFSFQFSICFFTVNDS